MVEYIRGEWNYIVRVNGADVVYSMDEPLDLLTAGTAVGFEDYHEAARLLNLSKRVATTAFKQTVSYLGEDGDPFSFVPRLSSNTSISTNFGYVGIELKNFYIRTQSLHDHISEVREMPFKERPYSDMGFSIVKVALFDDLDAFNL